MSKRHDPEGGRKIIAGGGGNFPTNRAPITGGGKIPTTTSGRKLAPTTGGPVRGTGGGGPRRPIRNGPYAGTLLGAILLLVTLLNPAIAHALTIW